MKFNSDEQYYFDHKKELLANYDGRFVAIRNGEVVADAATRREVEQRLNQRFGQPIYAMVRKVTASSFNIRPESPILIS